jgi:hypothetical protein
MINWLGARGAAIATLFTQSFCCVLLFCGIIKHTTIHINSRCCFAILLSLSSLACVAYLTRSFGIYVALPGATITYFVALMILGRKDFNVLQLIKLRR